MIVAAGVHVVSANTINPLYHAALLADMATGVKEYSSATANMFTAVLCSFFFPEKFSFTIYIMFAMVLLFTGIFMYERRITGSSNNDDSSVTSSSNTSNTRN